MFFYIILFFLSLFLFTEAPDRYSLPYVTQVFALFVVSCVVFLRSTFRTRNYFNFHLFFLLSIFFTNFAYPAFIYPLDPEYFSIFTFAFDHNLISRGTALSQLAVISYIVGVSVIWNFRKGIDPVRYEYTFSPSLQKILSVLTGIFALVFVLHVFYMFNENPDEEILNTQIVNICIVIFSIGLLVNTVGHVSILKDRPFLFVKHNIVYVIAAAVIVLFSIWFGDRGPAIEIFFILMFVYVTFIRKIKLRFLIPLVAFGLFLMTIISYTRGSDSNLKSGSIGNTITQASDEIGTFDSYWNYGMDLIVNNRNLFVALELGDRRELLYGKSYFPYLTSPIPGLPTILTEGIFGEKPEAFATSTIITKYTGLEWGVGSNAVGDIYMNYHTTGVIIIFFLFGLFISRLEQSKNIYGILSFTLIFALAIYYPRSSLLEQLSLVVRGIMILWIILKLTGNPKMIRKIHLAQEEV